MIKENHLIVNKTARYYTLGELNKNTKQIWFVLHGFRQSAKSFLQGFEPLLNDAVFFVAPEALNRFYLSANSDKVGASWMTKEDRLNEIKDYINYLNGLYETFEPGLLQLSVTTLGFSQGASTLTRWVNATPHRIDRAIVYAGEVAPEVLPLRENSGLKKTKNYYICGDKDEFFTDELRGMVKEVYKELNFSQIIFDGKHEINADALRALI